MTRHIGLVVTAIIVFLVSASLALGASLTIDSSGNGVFTVQGNNMDEVAAIDLTLSYDTPALASPSVNQGSLISGALLAANTNNPGSIRIAIAKASSFSGSGPVVTITFATHAGGSVRIASSNLVDINGNTLASVGSTSTTSGSNSAPDVPSSPPAATNPTTNPSSGNPTGTTGTAGSSGPTYLGTVTMPSDNQPQNEAKPAPAPETAARPASAEAPAPVETPAPGKPAAGPNKAKEIGTAANTAVLERFRAYHGAKTPAIMIALFKQPVSPSFHQIPFVALSDGSTTVTIVADFSAVSGGSPNFALKGAKLISLKKNAASAMWFIKALPAKGALSASLMVLRDDRVTEYPLTIAPKIPNAASTEAQFAAFFKDAAKTPAQHDVNGDGKYDGVDDYIYTANYLAAKQKPKLAAK